MAEEGGCTCHRRDTRTLHAPDKAQQEGRGAQSVRGGGTRLARRMTVRGPEACVRVLVVLVRPHGHLGEWWLVRHRSVRQNGGQRISPAVVDFSDV